MRKLLVLASFVSAAAFAGCVPKRDVPVSEIPKLTSLGDVMFVQATVADPQFKKAGRTDFVDADWAAFKDMGQRLDATSAKVKESFTKGPEFEAFATKLQEQSRALIAASDAKNAADASRLLGEMKSTCKECHKKFR